MRALAGKRYIAFNRGYNQKSLLNGKILSSGKTLRICLVFCFSKENKAINRPHIQLEIEITQWESI